MEDYQIGVYVNIDEKSVFLQTGEDGAGILLSFDALDQINEMRVRAAKSQNTEERQDI